MRVPLVAALLLYAANASAQLRRVADLHPGAESSAPLLLTAWRDTLYFTARTPEAGRELHRYDGANSPSLVADVVPGPIGNGTPGLAEPMAEAAGALYYAAEGPGTGIELYRYDGRNPPTLAGGEIHPGPVGADPADIHAIGSKVYFRASTPAHGQELWCHDPATGTNTRLTDLTPGGGHSTPSGMTLFGGRIYFAASSDNYQAELFAYDTATGVTALAADINPGPGDASDFTRSHPQYFTVHSGKLYFAAATAAFGAELFSLDASGSLTRVTDVAPGPAYSVALGSATGIVPYAGGLYFVAAASGAEFRLYRYDSLLDTTVLAKSFGFSGSSIDLGIVYRDALYFAASADGFGKELWQLTSAGATMMVDFVPGSGSSLPTSFRMVADRLYFSATDGTSGLELYELSQTTAVAGASPAVYGLALLPNPASGGGAGRLEGVLRVGDALVVEVLDAAGRVIEHRAYGAVPAGRFSVPVDLSGCSAGLYLLHLNGSGGKHLGVVRAVRP